jgi:hypothetical protein
MEHKGHSDTYARLPWILWTSFIYSALAMYYGFDISIIPFIVGMSILSTTLGHSFAQGDSTISFLEESEVGFVKHGLFIIPFIALGGGDVFLAALLGGFLQGIAGWLGYKVLNARGITLKLFGITWCDPARGSEWEEFLTGLFPYDIILLALFLIKYLGYV